MCDQCDVEPIVLECENKGNKETNGPNWKPPECDSTGTNDCCPSIDPSKVFPDTSQAAVELEDVAEADTFKLETAPFDPRFPNTNQTKHCYVSFLEHKRCIKLRGEDYTPCEYFKRAYTSLCPKAWVEKWEEQIEKGTFPGRI